MLFRWRDGFWMDIMQNLNSYAMCHKKEGLCIQIVQLYLYNGMKIKKCIKNLNKTLYFFAKGCIVVLRCIFVENKLQIEIEGSYKYAETLIWKLPC